MLNTLYQIMPYVLASATPLCITALGGLYSERSGVVNIALEGFMIIGSFVVALVAYYLYPSMGRNALWVGMLAAAVVGALVSLLHGLASITMNANQVISGTAINMFAPALTIYLARALKGSGAIQIMLGFHRSNVPILSSIPIIGKMFFREWYPTTYLVIAVLIITTILLKYSVFGMRLKACGENPHSVDAAGINVAKMRYISLMISGALGALGGAIMTVTIGGEFSGTMAGLGFLALAALVFGQWKPLGVAGATLFFGFLSTLSNFSNSLQFLSNVPPLYLKVLPYFLTLVALVVFSKKAQAPKAVGEPFDKGKR